MQPIALSEHFTVLVDSVHRSAMQRISTYSVVVLVVSTMLMLAVFCSFTFLWTAAHKNRFWR